MIKYLKLLRVEQWVKTFCFYSSFLFGEHYASKFLLKVFLHLLFSLIASSIYILNDYKDIESDQKKHPEKDRPLANGSISKDKFIFIYNAYFCGSVLLFLVKNIFKKICGN